MTSSSRRPNPVFSEDYRVLRETLALARRAARCSEAELAGRLGKSKSHVAMIERGQRRVDSLEFYRMAKCLGLEPRALFGCIVEGLDRLSTERAQNARAGE
jgi:transcriptional regulator with XRE-family HTH domain